MTKFVPLQDMPIMEPLTHRAMMALIFGSGRNRWSHGNCGFNQTADDNTRWPELFVPEFKVEKGELTGNGALTGLFTPDIDEKDGALTENGALTIPIVVSEGPVSTFSPGVASLWGSSSGSRWTSRDCFGFLPASASRLPGRIVSHVVNNGWTRGTRLALWASRS